MYRTYWTTLLISSFAIFVSSCGGPESTPSASEAQPGALKADELATGQMHMAAIESLELTDFSGETTEVVVTFLRPCNDEFIELVPNKRIRCADPVLPT